MVQAIADKEAAIYDQILAYRDDPIGCAINLFNVRPEYIWPKMAQICESVRDNQFTAVPAAHSVSKTFTVGRIVVPWFKICFEPSTVVTTAPSDSQIRNQLWREVHATVNGASVPLGGKLTTLMWDRVPSKSTLERMPPDARSQWEKNFAIGFSTSPDVYTEHTTKMQGWHNEWFLAVIDEACGIWPQIWRTIMDSLIVNSHCKVLAIGNATDPDAEFASVCRLNGKLDHLEASSDPYISDLGWSVIPISVFDTPNYHEGLDVIPGLAGRDYAENISKRHPKGSNGWLIRLRGAFPSTKEGTYYGLEDGQAKKENRIGHYPYDPSFPVYRFADFGDVWTAALDAQFIRGRIRIINDYWDNAGDSASHGGTEQVDGCGAVGVAKSMQAMPYVWGKEHFAGPDLEGSNKTSFVSTQTTRDVLRGLGVNFKAIESASFDEGIQAVRVIWPLLDIDESGAGTFIKAAKGYGKLKNERMSTDDQPVYHDQPAQTWHRHMMDALRHLAIAYRTMKIGGVYIGDSSLIAKVYSLPRSDQKPVDLFDRARFHHSRR